MRVTPTVEYGRLFDTDSIIANSAAVWRLKEEKAREREREKERKTEIKEEKRIQKDRKREERDQKSREKVSIDESKRLRGVGRKRKRDDPPELELNCIVKDCKLTWNTADKSKWMFCEHCDACCVCEGHWRGGTGKTVLDDHEDRCPHRPRKKPRVDS